MATQASRRDEGQAELSFANALMPGFRNWMLDQGVSRTEALATISEILENVARVAQLIANGIAYVPYH